MGKIPANFTPGRSVDTHARGILSPSLDPTILKAKNTRSVLASFARFLGFYLRKFLNISPKNFSRTNTTPIRLLLQLPKLYVIQPYTDNILSHISTFTGHNEATEVLQLGNEIISLHMDKELFLRRNGFTPIPGYCGYWAREDGVIASAVNREKNGPKILSPLVINSGYQTVQMYFREGCVRRTVHRLVATTFIPNPENLPTINHKNGNKLDNRAENLEWASYSRNIKHALETGLTVLPVGEDVHSAILTESQVLEIYEAYGQGESTNKLSAKYGISTKQINTIVLGKKWKHLRLEPIRRGVAKGEKSPSARFTESDVLTIRDMAINGRIAPEIAKEFGCSVSAIRHIVNRRCWKHV